jgi:hypothetical protein
MISAPRSIVPQINAPIRFRPQGFYGSRDPRGDPGSRSRLTPNGMGRDRFSGSSWKQGEIGPDLFRKGYDFGLRGSSASGGTDFIGLVDRSIGSL